MTLMQNAGVLAIHPETGTAEVDLEGVKAEVSVDLLDEIAVGDHVLVHAGFALNRVDRARSEATLAAIVAEAADGADETAAA